MINNSQKTCLYCHKFPSLTDKDLCSECYALPTYQYWLGSAITTKYSGLILDGISMNIPFVTVEKSTLKYTDFKNKKWWEFWK